jgi:DNA polymerase-3 subunit epsilon
MGPRAKLAGAVAGLYALSIAVAAAGAGALWATLDVPEREALAALIAPRAGLLAAVALLLALLVWGIARPLLRAYVSAPLEIAETTRIISAANPSLRVAPRGSGEMQDVAAAINALAEEHEALLQDVERRIGATQRELHEERNRLAALISDLAQSVLVCNVEGRILLYNERARRLLDDDSPPGQAAIAGASLVGLGRSVFALLERSHIVHALETLQARLQRGDPAPVASFVTTRRAGQLVRVQVAPVRGPARGDPPRAAAGPPPTSDITGFVLILDDVTRVVETGARNELVLQSLTESSRRALASIRAAAETLLAYPAMDPAKRSRFLEVIGEEAAAMGDTLDRTVREHVETTSAEWLLEEMLGANLVAAARARVEGKLGMRTPADEVDASLWLRVDSYSLLLALTSLAGRLRDECGVRELRFRLTAAGRFAQLDLVWSGASVPPDALARWESGSIEGEDGAATLHTPKVVVERHGGELWHQADGAADAGFIRLLLPAARREEPEFRPRTAARGRPEYYDFDLFHQAGQTAELDQRALGDLAYTVFDTETTGLQPSQGDEIISIGAVRIVNGRLLHHESFEQFVDPRRPISPESVRVTGIDPAMLRGQPTIERVLPQFHRYCADTVLVAHNAAFDMRFLQLKEAQAGVRFTQPVLDTLLLASVVQPQIGSSGLDALAERLGVAIVGRHTALGDAIMTGEIFLKLVPLLAERGIATLRDAREASERSLHARLRY